MTDSMARGGVRRYLDTVPPEEYKPNTGEVNLSELSLTGLADLFGSDKGNIKHQYTRYYSKLIDDILQGKDRKDAYAVTICEAGVACGASLRMWGYYLPNSRIIGYDVRPECAGLCNDMKNVRIVIENLCKSKKMLPPQIDMFIDDASHIAEDIVAMFENCWSNVRSGGYYVIEDLSCTYNPNYTEQYRKHFDKDAVNDRKFILKLMDSLMHVVDSRGHAAELRYYPQMLVVRKA